MQLHQVFCPDVRCTIPLTGYPSKPLEKDFIKINVQTSIDDIQNHSWKEKIINEKMINRYLKAKNDTNK